MTDYKKQGKKNRAAGARFELKVRRDLESKGWIVDKWGNNIELTLKVYSPLEVETKEEKSKTIIKIKNKEELIGKLIPAKRKYNPFNKVMAIGTGFPDFIAFRLRWEVGNFNEQTKGGVIHNFVKNSKDEKMYEVIGVEAKSNGYLDKEECAKCVWLLENNIFSKIIIVRKGEKRGEIIYKEFENVKV